MYVCMYFTVNVPSKLLTDLLTYLLTVTAYIIYWLNFVATYRFKNMCILLKNHGWEMDYFTLFQLQQQSWHYIYPDVHHGFI